MGTPVLKTPLSLPDLAVGDRVREVLLIWDVQQRSLRDGRGFTVLTLSNATGKIETAPFWPEEADQVQGMARGQVVQIIGEVQSYGEKRQLQVTSIRVLPRETVDLASLLPTVGDVSGYWQALDRWRGTMARPRVKRVVGLFYEDDGFRRRYETCPASISGHHAAIGGLVKHTAEVAHIARAIGRTANADPDLVLAGVLLHDIGKVEAYRWDGVFEYTDRGHLVGHVVLGSLMLDRRLAEESEPPCTAQEQDILHHLILSHHGKHEFGSPVLPMTLEAEVIHWADNASAKTASMAEILREGEHFGERLVSRQSFWQLDRRRLYRGRSDWGA